MLKADPGAARKRREQAQQDARVELWREDAGTAAIVSFGLPPDEALAADQQITTRAMELKAAGVPGSMDRLRVRAYLDALLGQDTTTRYTTGAHPADDGTAPRPVRSARRRHVPRRVRRQPGASPAGPARPVSPTGPVTRPGIAIPPPGST